MNSIISNNAESEAYFKAECYADHQSTKALKRANTSPNKRPGKIAENYEWYLKQPLHVGFMDSFPVAEILDSIQINTKCRNCAVRFNVHYAKVTFGEKNEYSCHAIVTDKVDIASHLPLGGWNSHAYADEAATMELAVVEMAKKQNLMINRKVCSWPFAKAITSPNDYEA
jgi:hypothetical protein